MGYTQQEQHITSYKQWGPIEGTDLDQSLQQKKKNTLHHSHRQDVSSIHQHTDFGLSKAPSQSTKSQ